MPTVVLVVTPGERATFLDPVLADLDGRWSWIQADPAAGGEALVDLLARTGAEALVTCWSSPTLPEDLPERCPRLRLIHHLCGTVRFLLPHSFLERGLTVCNWGATAAPVVAEHTLLLILASLRRLADHVRNLDTGGWAGPPARSLIGRRVGLHGFGAIARALVPLLAPFRCPVSAYAPGDPDDLLASLGVARSPGLAELYGTHEIVVCLAPLTPATRGVVTGELLARLPQGGLFVNVARGALVDEAALADLVAAGRIFAACDVTTVEPLPADAPLRRLPGALLTPHIAGPTPDRHQDCGALALANLRAWIEGRPVANALTPDRYSAQT